MSHLPNSTTLSVFDVNRWPIDVRRNDDRALRWAQGVQWAMHDPVLRSLMAVLSRHADGQTISETELQQIVAVRDRRMESRAEGRPADEQEGLQVLDGGIALVPVQGVIAKYASQVNQVSQPRGTSTEAVSRSLREALGREDVRAILLDIESPGGAVSGVDELAEEIRSAREHKPVFAIADGMAASAAYWIGSQAQEFAATRGSSVGSIGVYTPIVDSSGAAAEDGVKVHLVRSAGGKGIGMPGVEVSESDLAEVQREVNAFAGLFVDAVAAGRGFGREKAEKLADGRIYLGGEARKQGLIDMVASFEGFVAHIREQLEGVEGTADEAAVVVTVSPAAERGDAAGAVSSDINQRDMAEQTTQAAASPAVTQEPLPVETNLDPAALREEGAKAERERVQWIRGNAAQGQEELVEQLIDGGVAKTDALEELNADLRNRFESLQKAVKSDPVGGIVEGDAVGRQDEEIVIEGEGGTAAVTVDADTELRREWNGSRSLHGEFQDFETFKAYREGKARAARRPNFLRGGV